MHEEILKIVQEKLPSIHAEALGKHFKEAEATTKSLSEANERIDALRQTVDSANKRNETLQLQIKREVNLKAREDVVLAREQKQNVLDARLDCEKEKVALVKEMFKDVFRNSSVKRSIIGSTPLASGQYGVVLHPDSSEETTTQE